MAAAAVNVLVIGSGGREHALAWALARSDKVATVFVAPGNGGAVGGKLKPLALSLGDGFKQVVSAVKELNVALVVVGPEQPLVDGIADVLADAGIKCFGPSKRASVLEGSKAFSKEFMARNDIPTAEYRVFTAYDDALAYVSSISHRVVVKASGLAAGKGVLLPETKDETIDAIKTIMLDKSFGAAGEEVVIEEHLEGQEASVLAFSDGKSVVALPAAQDHKRAYDGDKGPNTGGMGAYAPAPVMTADLAQTVHDKILVPSIAGCAKEGFPYVGVLYAGIMLTKDGPKVLEYNCRLGDPETQVVLALLETDLLDVCMACVDGSLGSMSLKIRDGAAATVVAASGGYPGSYPKGKVIVGTDAADGMDGVHVFHAGTKVDDTGKLVTSGGRVLAVTGLAANLKDAVKTAYAGLGKISFDGMMYRKDIAHRALSVSYSDAGVDIAEGNRLVDLIKPLAKATRRTGCDAALGGFGGLFDLKAAGFKDPILVSTTDGVGTKLKVAELAGKHDTIGIDLVAMCVNDLIVQGAEPLLFLDYFATGKLAVDTAKSVVAGIADGCKAAGCALIGGETAEMPGMYAAGTYDLAGFSVGAAERGALLPTADVGAGDVVLGLASSGVHSNGYSLVRLLVERAQIAYSAPAPWAADRTMADVLLEPTRIYVKPVLAAIRQTGAVKALAHITGGGLVENIPRVLPDDVACALDASAWPLLPVFSWLFAAGNLSAHEAARTFNCGIGMVLVVAPANADAVTRVLEAEGEKVFKIGTLTPRSSPQQEQVTVAGAQTAWGTA